MGDRKQKKNGLLLLFTGDGKGFTWKSEKVDEYIQSARKAWGFAAKKVKGGIDWL